MKIETENDPVRLFLAELERIFGRPMSPQALADLSDSEIEALPAEKQEEFRALMAVFVITPELMFAPEFNSDALACEDVIEAKPVAVAVRSSLRRNSTEETRRLRKILHAAQIKKTLEDAEYLLDRVINVPASAFFPSDLPRSIAERYRSAARAISKVQRIPRQDLDRSLSSQVQALNAKFMGLANERPEMLAMLKDTRVFRAQLASLSGRRRRHGGGKKIKPFLASITAESNDKEVFFRERTSRVNRRPLKAH